MTDRADMPRDAAIDSGGFDRRGFFCAAAALAATAALPARGAVLTAAPRLRVIVDNDFSGDPDGLFQLAHQLASRSASVPLVIGSHLHPGEPFDPSRTQASNAARIAGELIDRMKLAQRPRVIAGRETSPNRGDAPDKNLAARAIVAEALRTDTDLPLVYAAGAGLTDLADALRIEPRIAGRMTLIWIGGPDYPTRPPAPSADTSGEYNLTIDIEAARTVFNDSAIRIWQVPRDVYRTMLVSHAELEAGLSDSGVLGRFLLDRLERLIRLLPDRLGETYILGDSPLVTLTALRSSFQPDTSSSSYVVRPTPRIDRNGAYERASRARAMRVYTRIDTRLTFADMFAKLRLASI